tara:strand:+ start:1870 stop:2208 length:339 start_codon:yes stop_codon:yes gene_type:complete
MEKTMSKYLKQDSKQHHYESEIAHDYKKQINYIKTMREYANEYQAIINKNAIDISGKHMELAMLLYDKIFTVTKILLLHIENNMYVPDTWQMSVQKVNKYVTEFEQLTKEYT